MKEYKKKETFIRSFIGKLLIMTMVFVVFPYSLSIKADSSEYSEESWAKLMDNTLEYPELKDLIHNFNKSIQQSWKTYHSNIGDITKDIEELEAGKMRAKSLLDSAKEEGDFETIGLYTAQLQGFHATIKGLKKSKESLTKENNSSIKNLQKAENQVLYAGQTLMIHYQSTISQKNILEAMVLLYQQILESKRIQVNVGLATSVDIIEAQTNLAKAQSDLENIRITEQQLKRTLITMCGWQADANPVIQEIPIQEYISEERMSKIHLEEDIRKAVGNSPDLMDIRHGKHSYHFVKENVREMTEKQLEAELRIKMQELYQNILNAESDLKTSNIALESADIKKNASNTQRTLGVISQLQYQQIELGHLQTQMQVKVAECKLLLSILEYENMIAGNLGME